MRATYNFSCDAVPEACNLLAPFNLVGAAGCAFWVLAYVFIIRQSFRDRTYGLPLVAICTNFAWELLASFVFPNPVWLWHTFDRAWLVIDVIIVYQLLRWGRDEQRIDDIRQWFYPIVAGTLALAIIGQYTFVLAYYDRLGLVVAFGVNLLMSALFIFFYFDRRTHRRGISKAAAWFKMLGTAGTSIECHHVVPLIDPELPSLAFLTYLSVSIFLLDCLYIYLVSRNES